MARDVVNWATPKLYISIVKLISPNCEALRGLWLYRNSYNRRFVRVGIALPTKLSIILEQGKQVEIQRTLDSNYGLFELVITDCKTVEVKCANQNFDGNI